MLPRRVYIETNGCSVLRLDTHRYAKYFRLNGWEETCSLEDADLVLMTSCGVTQEMEDETIRALDSIRKRIKPEAKMILGGCLPKINPAILEGRFKAAMFGPGQEGVLDDLIRPVVPFSEVLWDGKAFREHSTGPPGLYYIQEELDQLESLRVLSEMTKNPNFLEIYNYLTRGRYFWKEDGLFEVKVAEGCNYRCNFCATKNAKGPLKSVPLERIIQEFAIGVREGYRKIVLSGDEVGEYGSDRGTNLVALLNQLAGLITDQRIALRYVSPSSLLNQLDDLLQFFQDNRIYYFCAAIQSGSPKVLRRMGRSDNLAALAEANSKINAAGHLIYKHTQIIVGFPGESEEDFQATLDYVTNSGFDYAGVTRFSARPNTPAFHFEGKLSQEVIDERYARATAMRDRIRARAMSDKIFREIMSHH